MRSPHLFLSAAVRGVTARRSHGRDSPGDEGDVSLVGRVQRGPGPAEMGTCSVAGCGAPATLVAGGAGGRTIALCARCAEELDAILGISSEQ